MGFKLDKINFEGKKKKYTPKKRTGQQNRALHLFCKLLAEALNDAGWSVQRLLKEKSRVDIDWDTKTVKDIIWRPIQKSVLHKKSTTELNKQGDIDLVYDHIIRFLTDPKNPVLDEPIPWPDDGIDYQEEGEKLRRKL